MATHSSILAWKIPWRKSLVGYSPWGRKESDTTERLFTNESMKYLKSLVHCSVLGCLPQRLHIVNITGSLVSRS